jgi:hypothetical protein
MIKTLPPFTIVFLRVGLAAVILNVLVRALGMRMPGTRTAWLAFSGMGLLNNALPFWLIVWGQSHIASGLAAIDGRLLGRIWRLACSNLIKPAPQNYRPPSSRRPFQK